MRARTHEYLGGVSRDLDCPAIIVGGVDDHVHLLGEMDRSISVSQWIKELKRVSSTWAKAQDPSLRDFRWQGGYAAFAVSPSNLSRAEAYVRNQEEHHRTMSFQDELRTLLKKHGIEWDERYLWD